MTLTDKEIIKMIELDKKGVSLRTIGGEFGVSHETVRNVLKAVKNVSKIREECLWRSTCEKLCTKACKTYKLVVKNIAAKKRLKDYFNERKKLREETKDYYDKKWAK